MRPSAGCGALTLLLEINLCDNNLHMLPSDLGLLLGSLETLRIAGNPLSLLPPALLAAGCNFRAALQVAAAAGHDEVRATLVKVGGEGGAEGEQGGYEELALRDCDT